MKNTFVLLVLSALTSGSVLAQGEMDAFNYSYNDLTGTARSVSMGGAFGALGGDISGIAINPAGIGVYKSSEVVTTLNFTNNRTETNLLGSKTKDSKFNFAFDNIAFVGTVQLDSDIAPLINFGFSYNKLKSYNRKIALYGQSLSLSQTGYIAGRVDGIPNSELTATQQNNPFLGDTDHWLGGLAFNTGIIQNIPGSTSRYESGLNSFTNVDLDNRLLMEEKGSVDSYDFNVGTTFSDMLSVGATVSLTDINYRLYSVYTEDWFSNTETGLGGYDMENFLRTDGTGWQLKVGLILKPIQELRIGVAYHSPTWYQMTDSYWASVVSDIQENKGIYTEDFNGLTFFDYNFRSPDKWIFSLAGVVAQRFILSADYELTNYKNMHLKDINDFPFTEQNGFIKNDFRNASTLRLGAEIRITPQFSARAGYMWQQSPFQTSFRESNAIASERKATIAATEGSVTQYSIVGNANYFTYGLGYKFSPSIYTDIAFVMKSRKDDLYTFGGSDRAELKNNVTSGLITVGYKF